MSTSPRTRTHDTVRTVPILLVEDNEADIAFTREALKDVPLPNRLDVVTDGEMALAYLRHEPPFEDSPTPGLVLLDLNLPRVDGREVLRVVKTDPELQRIPVAVLTTSSSPSDIKTSYLLHASCYITKPVTSSDFIAMVQKLQGFWFDLVALPSEHGDPPLPDSTADGGRGHVDPEPGGRDFSAGAGQPVDAENAENPVQPSSGRRVAEGARGFRRAALLSVIQKVILGSLLFGLAVNNTLGAAAPSRGHWTYLLVGLVLLTALAWRLGAVGYYRLAATGTLLVTLAIPWTSFLLDASILRGDYVPMSYAVIPLMLAAMLLGVRAVIVVAALEGAGFAVLIALAPDSGFNWPSLLSLILVVAAISFTYAIVSHIDLHNLRVANEGLTELRKLLEQESRLDPLTGLHNRRSLEERAEGEISRARRSGTGLGLVMLDIDHFKEINDEHGHLIGDEVLVALASRLSAHSRAGDIACRLGGDEFLLILVDSNPTGTALRAERLREDLQKARPGAAGQPITVSVGVSSYPEHGDRFDVLLEAADRALYAAKADGRNRVVAAP